MNPDPNAIDWNADVTTTPEQEYRVLLKSLRRAQGFKLFFVQCAPAEGERLIAQVREDLPQKRIDVLPLKAPIANLYDLVVPCKDQSEILFISGLEHSLYDYEKERLWNEDGIYRFDAEADKQRHETGVPRVLSHLNLSRERFQRDFPFSFVFLVPLYALKYLIRRAPDFFDWRSGVLEFIADPQVVEQESQRIVLEGDFERYLVWTPQERAQRILDIQSWLEEPHQTADQKIELLWEQGNLFHASLDHQAHVASIDRVLAIQPDNYAAWYNRGFALSNLGCYEEAIKNYEQAIAIKPDYYCAWNSKGFVMACLEHYEEAIKSYDCALAIKPDAYLNWGHRGLLLSKLKRYEEAVKSYDCALAIKPDNFVVWNDRGNALSNLERYEEAVKSYDQVLTFQPDYSIAWNSRGVALSQLGRDEEAIASFDRFLAMQPEADNTWFIRGVALKNLGRYEEAIVCFDKALELKPDDYFVWSTRGSTLFDSQQYEAAVASYDKAVELNPNSSETWIVRSTALIALGRIKEAIASCDKAIELDKNTDRELRDTLLLVIDRYEKALASYDHTLTINPDDYEAWNNRGVALRNLGREDEATESFNKAIALNPKYVKTQRD